MDCTSIQWGAWAEVGMVSNSVVVHHAMERLGIGLIKPAIGLATMASLVRTTRARWLPIAVAIPFNWPKFMALPKNATLQIFSEFLSMEKKRVATVRNSILDANVSIGELLIKVISCVQSVQVLDVKAGVPLIQAGLDSLGKSLLYYFCMCISYVAWCV